MPTDEILITELVAYKKMLNVFVECLLYEPSNYKVFNENVDISSNSNKYINPSVIPTTVHPYLAAFRRGDESIGLTESFDACCDMLDCLGPGYGPHPFMSMEGYNKCTECEVIMCNTCTFQNDQGLFCVNCYATSHFVTLPSMEQNKPTNVMVQMITQHGYSISVSDSYEDILDMYDSIVNRNRGVFERTSC
jgi:hypothetical protein